MTPYEIGILLHIYASADDHPDERSRPPAYGVTIERFLEERLIECTHSGCTHKSYAVTDRGKFYVERGLMCVPLPVRDWRIPVFE